MQTRLVKLVVQGFGRASLTIQAKSVLIQSIVDEANLCW